MAPLICCSTVPTPRPSALANEHFVVLFSNCLYSTLDDDLFHCQLPS